MTFEILETRVAQAMASAHTHANNCHSLIAEGSLAAALEYCTREGIDPPQCSLTAQSENANKLRMVTKRKLSDFKWWEKALETKAIRGYEAEQRAQGNVRNYVSDGAAAYYMQKQKARK